MYDNVHTPITSLEKAKVKLPGICPVKFFKWEDVLVWPVANPLTGVISSAIQMKPGKSIYLCEPVDQSRSFEESQKDGIPGDYFEITCKGELQGMTIQNQLTLSIMKHHQWGLLVDDRSGYTRLIGDKNSGADFSHNYSSGTISESRKTPLSWKWESPMPAPIYTSQDFEIVIGGVQISAGQLQLVMRFRVGDVGAPMNEGDTILANSSFINKHCLVIASSLALPTNDGSGTINWAGSIERHVEKTLASNTIVFKGSVTDKEIIEIYAFN